MVLFLSVVTLCCNVSLHDTAWYLFLYLHLCRAANEKLGNKIRWVSVVCMGPDWLLCTGVYCRKRTVSEQKCEMGKWVLYLKYCCIQVPQVFGSYFTCSKYGTRHSSIYHKTLHCLLPENKARPLFSSLLRKSKCCLKFPSEWFINGDFGYTVKSDMHRNKDEMSVWCMHCVCVMPWW